MRLITLLFFIAIIVAGCQAKSTTDENFESARAEIEQGDCKGFPELQLLKLLMERYRQSPEGKILHLTQKGKDKDREGSDTCEYCVYIFESIKQIFENERSRRQIYMFLIHMCEELPYYESYMCTIGVENYFPVLVEKITHANSTVVCSELGLCTLQICLDYPKRDP